MSGIKTLTNWAGSSTIVHVGFAFAVMGGWAMWVNRLHGLERMLISGLAQGVVSGTLTLFLKKALEAMSPRFSGMAGFIAPPLITASVIFVLLLGVHTLARTPEILATISFPFAVSTTYAIAYNWKLCRGAWA
jgi:hypothetical protein